MNIKLALTALLCSVAMSCSVSEGQLLDRMLSKTGCTACQQAASGGCASGDCGGQQLLQNLRNRYDGSGSGSVAAAEVVSSQPCGCEAAPAPVAVAEPCGCEAAPAPVTVAEPCGCEAAPAPVAVAEPCGCEAAAAPEFVSAPCGCDAAPASAPVAEPCGCSAAPAGPVAHVASAAPAAPAIGGGGLLARLKRMMDSTKGGGGGCGCSAAPVAEGCGCGGGPAVPFTTPIVDAAPVVQAPSGCGCGEPAFVSAPVQAVQAPAHSSCGCDGGCGASFAGERPRLSFRDKLMGNRVARDRDGRVIGARGNGCNPPCPEKPEHNGCGCGAIAEPVPYVETGCVDCGTPCQSCQGEVIGGEVIGAPVYGGAAAGAAVSGESSIVEEPVITEEPADSVDPVSPVDAEDASDVLEKVIPKLDDAPKVDPKVFAPRRGPLKS